MLVHALLSAFSQPLLLLLCRTTVCATLAQKSVAAAGGAELSIKHNIAAKKLLICTLQFITRSLSCTLSNNGDTHTKLCPRSRFTDSHRTAPAGRVPFVYRYSAAHCSCPKVSGVTMASGKPRSPIRPFIAGLLKLQPRA